MEEGLIIKRKTAVSSGNIPEKKGSKLARSRDSSGHSHERRGLLYFWDISEEILGSRELFR